MMLEIHMGMDYVLFFMVFSFWGFQVTHLLPTGNTIEGTMKIAVPL